MSRQIKHSVEIDASPSTVWAILSDVGSYPSWNPFMVKVDGELRPGARLAVTIQPPGRRRTTFRPTVLRVDAERQLRWLGRFLVPGLFDGEHSFELEPAPGGTRLTQAEHFRGLLVRPFSSGLDASEAGFQHMNAALKQRAEALEGTA